MSKKVPSRMPFVALASALGAIGVPDVGMSDEPVLIQSDGIPRTDSPRYRKPRGLRKKSRTRNSYTRWRRTRMRMQRESRRRNRR